MATVQSVDIQATVVNQVTLDFQVTLDSVVTVATVVSLVSQVTLDSVALVHLAIPVILEYLVTLDIHQQQRKHL